MAYATGVANDVDDLLDKLRLFLSGEGWVVNRWSDPDPSHTQWNIGSNPERIGKELCVESPSGDGFFNFRSTKWTDNQLWLGTSQFTSTTNPNVGILMNGSDGFNAANRYDEMPGHPANISSGRSPNFPRHAYTPIGLQTAGPFQAYHFFLTADAETCYVVVEAVAGIFYHFGFGKLDTFNSGVTGEGRFFFGATGGNITLTGSSGWLNNHVDHSTGALEIFPGRAADVFGSMNNNAGSFVRAAQGSYDGWFFAGRTDGSTSTGTPRAFIGGGVYDKNIRELAPDPLNGVGVLVPAMFAIKVGDNADPLGVMPSFRGMRMDNYLPGDEFTLGSDTWVVFPWYQQAGWSEQRGMAYLKTV